MVRVWVALAILGTALHMFADALHEAGEVCERGRCKLARRKEPCGELEDFR